MGEYLFLGCAILSITNGAILVWVNPKRTVNQTFFLCCACICVWCLCVSVAIRKGAQSPIPLESLHFWLRASSGVGAFLCWLIWLTKTALIERNNTLGSILGKSWPWFILSCMVAGIAFSESFIPSTATPQSQEHGWGYHTYFIVITICCGIFLIDALRRDKELSGIRKIELRYFVVNAIVACLLVVLAHALSFYIDKGWPRRAGLIFFTLLNGTAVWAICHHRVFDAKHLVFSVGQRVILLCALGVAAVATWLLLSERIRTPWNFFVATVGAAAIGIWCDRPLRRWLGLDPSQIILAPRKAIIDFSRKASNEESLRMKFAEFLRNWCQTDSAYFLSSTRDALSDSRYSLEHSWPGFGYLAKNGWATPEALQRLKSEVGTIEISEFLSQNDFGVILATPKGRNPPSLVVCLGQKESLRPYTFPDIEVLMGLAELMDNILAHSKAAAHVAQIERMESASMMSRGLAHDLSNLITPVATFVSHMETKVSVNSPEGEVLADAKHSIEVMQNYIQENLFFIRNLAPKFKKIDPQNLLLSVKRLCQDRAKAGSVEIRINSTLKSPFVADPALIQRLLQNLVLNAIDASPPGNRVELLLLNETKGLIIFEVRDQGVGVAPHLLDRIFEPYFTTKRSGNTLRGMGLGLAICRKIADLHKGNVSAKCSRETGTIFAVTLPIFQEVSACSPIEVVLQNHGFNQPSSNSA